MATQPPTLGRLIRSLRHRNGWTLKEMSELADISFSTLAKVEHDRLSLSYDKLQRLSDRLGIRMSDFLAEASDRRRPPVTGRRSFGKFSDAIRTSTGNYDYHYLCEELRGKRMIPVMTHVRARTVEQFGDLDRHSGEEYIYVLHGRIKVYTEFYAPVLLDQSESMYIDSEMGHAYLLAEGCDDAKILAICSSADEAFMTQLAELRKTSHLGAKDNADGTASPHCPQARRLEAAYER